MKPSFQKYLNLIKHNYIFLPSNKIELLHNLLFSSNKSIKLDINNLEHKLNISEYNAEKIYMALLEEGVIRIEKTTCPECSQNINEHSSRCPNCNTNFNTNLFYTNIDSVLNEQQIIDSRFKHKNKKQIKRLIDNWKNNGFISYLIFDLVNSEALQKEEFYDEFWDVIRYIIKYRVLPRMEKTCIALSEVGDCFQIAFSDINESINFGLLFSKEISQYKELNKFLDNHPKIKNFPKFRSTLEILNLPKNKVPEDIIFTTLNGSLDFNTEELTKLFRLDNGINLKNNKTFKKHNVALWIGENLMKQANLNYKTEIVHVGKNFPLEKKVSLVLFNNGEKTIIDNPQDYIKKYKY